MNGFRVGAVSLLASFVLAFSGNAAQAQSADGLLDNIKGVLSDPVFGSFLMSKIASPSSIIRKPETQVSNYGNPASSYGYAGPGINQPALPENFPDNGLPAAGDLLNAGSPDYSSQTGAANPGFRPPDSGFYSLEQGAALGGIGYNPARFGNAAGNYSRQSDPTPPIPINYLRAALPQVPAMGNSPPLPGNALSPAGSQMTITNRLAPAELRQLSRFDISVLIDKSGSMSTKDCPNQFFGGRNISRWEWCREQSALLTQQTAGALPAGITIVPFASNFQRFANATPDSINRIFNSASPDGSTNLAGALESEFDRYFQERDAGYRQRPLMIAVITDGVPDSKSAVRRVIREASQRIGRPEELRIVFFVIGQDRNGADFVDELATNLVDDGAPFNIVLEHSFSEVNQVGLARSLASSAIR